MNKKNYLILYGGTGGHVIPAVRFGNFVIDKGYNCYLFVDARGYKYTSLFKGKVVIINSSHFSVNFFGKIRSIFLMLFGFLQSSKHILKIKPKACISFGSYATFIPLSVLFFLNYFGFCKFFLHEQNSIMGKVNNLFAPFANKIFLNYENTLRLKKKYYSKTKYVGLPFDFKMILKKRNINFIKNNKKIRIFICGGSQGAVSLNKIMINIFNKFPRNILNQIQFSIQCPDSQKKEICKFFDKLSVKYELRSFFDEFIKKLYESDVLITRAGAGTVNDVILTKIPAIFVPLPSSANDHQFYNANFLKQKKAALLIEQKYLNSQESLSKVIELISNITKQNDLIKNLQKIKNFDSNQLIFQYLNEKK